MAPHEAQLDSWFVQHGCARVSKRSARAGGAVCQLPTVSHVRHRSGVSLRHLLCRSYERMGRPAVTCEGGCACGQPAFEAFLHQLAAGKSRLAVVQWGVMCFSDESLYGPGGYKPCGSVPRRT
jgi:hypothetical protein